MISSYSKVDYIKDKGVCKEIYVGLPTIVKKESIFQGDNVEPSIRIEFYETEAKLVENDEECLKKGKRCYSKAFAPLYVIKGKSDQLLSRSSIIRAGEIVGVCEGYKGKKEVRVINRKAKIDSFEANYCGLEEANKKLYNDGNKSENKSNQSSLSSTATPPSEVKHEVSLPNLPDKSSFVNNKSSKEEDSNIALGQYTNKRLDVVIDLT